MELEISWGTITKFFIVGICTYVLLPVALILRDWLLRKIIEKFILNEKLEKKISEYAWKEMQMDKKYSKSSGGGYRNGKEYFVIEEKEVSKEEYFSFSSKQHSIQHELRRLYTSINNTSAFINWIYRHYKQDDVNPIPNWLEDERKRFSKFNEKS